MFAGRAHEDFTTTAGTVVFDLSPYARIISPPYLFLNGTAWQLNSSLVLRLTLLSSGSWDTQISVEVQYICSSHFEGSLFFSNQWWAVGEADDVALKVIYFLPSCASSASHTSGRVLLARNLREDVVKAIRVLQRLHGRDPRLKLLLHLADGFATPKVWPWYVDDTFVVIERVKVYIFKERLNNVFTNIQFMMEKEESIQFCLP
ncbi:unnamed protein product [Dibothriocephalus latus]|uniref:Uncharacterized protein n=1 Tax=Dibothriocephalus latus TaxID=60516 RepID=A0A3P7LQ79_DIBLA|nr:unnamed protein product [Dibothriocephalus latus]